MQKAPTGAGGGVPELVTEKKKKSNAHAHKDLGRSLGRTSFLVARCAASVFLPRLGEVSPQGQGRDGKKR